MKPAFENRQTTSYRIDVESSDPEDSQGDHLPVFLTSYCTAAPPGRDAFARGDDAVDPSRKAARWLIVLLAILASGTLGIRYFTDSPWIDSLFYTVITLSTVGYGAPPGLPVGGKIFVILLILIGIGTAGLAIGEITRYFVIDKMLSVMGKRRDSRVKDLDNHWILAGLGRVGMEVARHLGSDGIPFVAVEVADRKVASAREHGWIVQQGDARQEAVLEEAGIKKAKGLILTLSDDSDNVYATLTAKALNPVLRIIARANDSQSAKLLKRAGAERAMNLADAEAAAIARASINPAVADFLEMVNISRDLGLDFSAARVNPESYVVGMTLAEAPLRFEYNAMVIAIKKEHGSIIYNPPGGEVLEGGDELILFAEMDKMEELRALLCRPGEC